MTQVMLSHPVPSPDVSGAKQWSSNFEREVRKRGISLKSQHCYGNNSDQKGNGRLAYAVYVILIAHLAVSSAVPCGGLEESKGGGCCFCTQCKAI